MLAVPPGTDEAAYERAGYVSALREANAALRALVSYESGMRAQTRSVRGQASPSSA